MMVQDFENDLIEKSKQGDIESFERLICDYQKMVFNIAYRMLGNMEDAHDAAQEAFIKVYKSIGSFNGQSSFSTWLYKIATNTCLDELRKRKKAKTISYDEPIRTEDGDLERDFPDEHQMTEEIFERKESIKSIQEAINGLPEQHKAMIVLRDIRGFSYEEIAEMLDCPEGTIKSRISRARSALKNIMEKQRELYQFPFVKL